MGFAATATGLMTPTRQGSDRGFFMAETTTQNNLTEHSLFTAIRQGCKRFQIVSLNRQIEICKTLLTENPPIDVAILGQFKAGKSSFLNGLLGKHILPTGVVPVTTVITRLQYGPEERAMVTYFNGSRTEISLQKLSDFISEQGNPNNAKDVDVVDVETPILKDYPGLRLVDTPGLGSIFRAHMKTSQEWLPAVGAAIVAVSSDRPLSDDDLALLGDLARHTPNIFLLLTKVDLLTIEQRKEVVCFLEKSLKKELKKVYPIYLFSNRLDTELYSDPIAADILSKLSVHRDSELQNLLQHKVRSLALSCLGYLEIARESALRDDLERDEIRRRILDKRLSLTAIHEDLMLIARENSRQTRIFIMQHLAGLQIPLQEKFLEDLKRELFQWRGNLWRLTRRYEEWLTDEMATEMERISRNENRSFLGTLEKARNGFDRILSSFRALLGQNVERVLGLKLAEVDWPIDVDYPDHPDVGFIRVFDFHFDLLWFLIPMALFRGFFERHFLSLIPSAVEVNLSRLGAQWEGRINVTIEAMRKQAMEYVKAELATIEALMADHRGDTGEIENLIEDITRKLADRGPKEVKR